MHIIDCMKKSKLSVGLAVPVALVIVSSLVVFGVASQTHQSNRLGLVAKIPVTTPTPTPILNSMQIEAIRARPYVASLLTVTQNLGDQGGYHEAINSYISDGLTQYTLVSTPNGVKPTGGWPVVIVAHGYIDPAAYLTAGVSYSGIISELARAGYLVVKPDYRGHGKSQGSAEGGHFSPVYSYDILNLIASLKKYPDANPARIGLLGHSLGGHVALRTIVASKDVKATVFMAGVVGSLHDVMYSWPHSPLPMDRPAALVQSTRTSLLTKYGTPEANPDFWNTASAINYVKNVSGAVQINHAVGDSVVPVMFSDHLNAALINQHKYVEYFQYPGNDHNFSANHTLLMKRILAFYAAHL